MTSTASSDTPLRCSTWTREQRLDPIGTIGSYAGFLLLDMPLPWPRDVSEMAAMTSVLELVRGRGVRLQARVPSGPARQATLYHRGPADEHAFAGYERWSVELPDSSGPSELGDAVTSLLAGSDEGHPRRQTTKEVLVCTHGRRDVCCGSMGTALAVELGAAGGRGRDPGKGPLGPGVVVRRTSHTGGHRFAPTAIVLPEGTGWAHADVELLRRVTERRGEAAEVAEHYRGCAGLGSPAIQALEREVLRQEGWDLLDRPRWGEQLGEGQVRLQVRNPDGSDHTWEAEVTAGRRLPVPDCGQPIELAKKSETELVVRSVAHLAH